MTLHQANATQILKDENQFGVVIKKIVNSARNDGECQLLLSGEIEDIKGAEEKIKAVLGDVNLVSSYETFVIADGINPRVAKQHIYTITMAWTPKKATTTPS